jgi:hypothetical protein
MLRVRYEACRDAVRRTSSSGSPIRKHNWLAGGRAIDERLQLPAAAWLLAILGLSVRLSSHLCIEREAETRSGSRSRSDCSRVKFALGKVAPLLSPWVTWEAQSPCGVFPLIGTSHRVTDLVVKPYLCP